MAENTKIVSETPASLLVNAAGDLPTLALRPREAAKALGISERTLWAMTKRGEVPHVRFNRAVLYVVDDLRSFLTKRRIGGAA